MLLARIDALEALLKNVVDAMTLSDSSDLAVKAQFLRDLRPVDQIPTIQNVLAQAASNVSELQTNLATTSNTLTQSINTKASKQASKKKKKK